jgi:hypothetical protein
MEITLRYGQHYDEVLVDGKPLSPKSSQKVWNHSPDGFSWGYGGSGPSQLALALLLEAGLDDETAVRLHQDFKFAFVANWPNEPGTQVHNIDIDAWVAEHAAAKV